MKRLAIQKTFLERMYIEQEMSSDQIATHLKVARSSIQRYLSLYKIRRTRSEAQRVAYTKLRRKPILALKGRTGPNHPSWKGGTKTHKGYRLCLHPEHPRSDKRGYILEHILRWEEYHQRSLPEGWVVHHINGIRDDNRAKNLMAMPKRNHHNAFLLQALRERIRSLENELQKIKAERRLL